MTPAVPHVLRHLSRTFKNFQFIWVSYVKLRSRLGGGKGMEIDVEGGAGKECWICENKWWSGRKVGLTEVESLLRKGKAVKEEVGEGLRILRLWFFAHNGFTQEAEALMHEKGALWSVRKDLDGLLEYLGLKKLPELAGEKKVKGSKRGRKNKK